MPPDPMKFILSILCALCAASFASAQHAPVGIAYYDVDRLYDTLPSPFYDDSDFTPEGRLQWSSERYARKIRNTAAVIDSLGLEIVALWGVENEQVVRDLATACRGDYAYIHRTLNSLDGMDFALLYYGDRLFPSRVTAGRRSLRIDGEIDGREVTLLLCADPRMAERLVNEARRQHPSRPILLLGRTAIENPEQWGLRDVLQTAARAGRGNRRSQRGARWEMRDRLLADTAFKVAAADVFARRFLLDSQRGTPLPTFEGRQYRGGFGYALPVYVYIW